MGRVRVLSGPAFPRPRPRAVGVSCAVRTSPSWLLAVSEIGTIGTIGSVAKGKARCDFLFAPSDFCRLSRSLKIHEASTLQDLAASALLHACDLMDVRNCS